MASGGSRQRRKTRREEERIANEVSKKLSLPRTDTEIPVATSKTEEPKVGIREKASIFWGSTPAWAVIGMIAGVVASQLSLKLLFVIAWTVTFGEFIRVKFFEKRKRIIGNALAGIILVLIFYMGWKVMPKPHEPLTLDQEMEAFARKFSWLSSAPKVIEPELPPRPSQPIAKKKPSFLYVAPGGWVNDVPNSGQPASWDFLIRHSGPDPVNNTEMVFSDEYKIKDATAHNQSPGMDALYKTFHLQEVDPDEGFWAKQFLWSPVNPDNEEYDVVAVSREGRVAEHLEIIGKDHKDWQIAMKIVNPVTHETVLHCRDSKFQVSEEFPKNLPKCFPEFTTGKH